MNTIIANYKLLVTKYQQIEVSVNEKEIHDKRVTLRRIFQLLDVYKMKPARIRNGVKEFKLFGKLRDIQVQILKLESIDHTQEIIEYLEFLKGHELKLKEKVSKFCNKKKLEFPTLKKKLKVDKSSIYKKADKSLNKLIDKIKSRSIDDADDIHKIRIEFKKFRYKAEILSYIENIDQANLEMMKMYQDKLGEIQDYEVLIKGIKKYYKKRKSDVEGIIELFENEQNSLIENFDNRIEMFVAVCKDVISLNALPLDINNETVSSAEDNDSDKNENLSSVNHETENNNTLNSVDESVNERINKLGSTQDNVSESSIAVSSLDSKESKNHEELNLIEDQDNEKCNLLGSTNDKVSDNNENNSKDKQISEIIEAVKLKAVKPNLKKKRIKKADVPLKADLQDSEID